jgi:hypothetical protein
MRHLQRLALISAAALAFSFAQVGVSRAVSQCEWEYPPGSGNYHTGSCTALDKLACVVYHLCSTTTSSTTTSSTTTSSTTTNSTPFPN